MATVPVLATPSRARTGVTRAVSAVGRAVTLRAVMMLFVALTGVVAATTPAYEANDEPDHVLNVQTLLDGRWYRIEPGAGYEPHQPPLYYLGLAAYQKAFGLPRSFQAPVGLPGTVFDGIYNHDHADAQRRYVLLRLPSILLGLVTIYLTFRIALLAELPRSSAIAAAALTAFLPRFTFLSSVVNNDNLANALGALVIFLGFTVAKQLRAGVASSANRVCLGLSAGAALLTKFSVAPVLVAVAMVLVLDARRARKARALALPAVLAGLLSAPLFVSNQRRYGDALAARASIDQFKPWVPSLVDVDHSVSWYVKRVGSGFHHSFWYTSGVNQFRWHTLVYVLLSALALVGIAGALIRINRLGATSPVVTPLRLLGVWLAGVSTVWVLATSTTQWQGRVSYPALAAFSVLVVAGYHRLGVPRLAQFLLPVLCLLGVLVAIRSDIIARYYSEVRPANEQPIMEWGAPGLPGAARNS